MAAVSASFAFGAAMRRAPAQLRVAHRSASAPSVSRALTTTVKAAKEVIATDKSPAALGPYSQAIKVRRSSRATRRASSSTPPYPTCTWD